MSGNYSTRLREDPGQEPSQGAESTSARTIRRSGFVGINSKVVLLKTNPLLHFILILFTTEQQGAPSYLRLLSMQNVHNYRCSFVQA